jgi:hypothetical protein
MNLKPANKVIQPKTQDLTTREGGGEQVQHGRSAPSDDICGPTSRLAVVSVDTRAEMPPKRPTGEEKPEEEETGSHQPMGITGDVGWKDTATSGEIRKRRSPISRPTD